MKHKILTTLFVNSEFVFYILASVFFFVFRLEKYISDLEKKIGRFANRGVSPLMANIN